MDILNKVESRLIIAQKHIEKLKQKTSKNFYPLDTAIISSISKENGKIEVLNWIKSELLHNKEH